MCWFSDLYEGEARELTSSTIGGMCAHVQSRGPKESRYGSEGESVSYAKVGESVKDISEHYRRFLVEGSIRRLIFLRCVDNFLA